MRDNKVVDFSLSKNIFLIKKKLKNLKIDHPMAILANSEPVTPLRKLNCEMDLPRRNTIDTYTQSTRKNKRQMLPILNNDKNLSILKDFKAKTQKKLQITQLKINPEIQRKQDGIDSEQNDHRIRLIQISDISISDSRVRNKSHTIGSDKPQIKPLTIQNKLIPKFYRIKKPLSNQQSMRPMKSKLLISQTTPTQCSQDMLFTFYPRKISKDEQNQFLQMY